MSKSLSNRRYSDPRRRAGPLRWAAALAFAIVIATSGIHVVYAHQHDEAAESVSTSAGPLPLAMHLQRQVHDGATPGGSLHYHDSGALAHSPAAIGAIGLNVPLIIERTRFADPLCAMLPAFPELFLRPPP